MFDNLFFVATPTFLPALANLYGDKSTMMLLSSGGVRKTKKSGSISTSKVDSTHGEEKVCIYVYIVHMLKHQAAVLYDATDQSVTICYHLLQFLPLNF